MFSIDSFVGHASDATFTVPHMISFIFAIVFVNAKLLCNHTPAHVAPVQPPFTAHGDGRAYRHVCLRKAWPRCDCEWSVAADTH